MAGVRSQDLIMLAAGGTGGHLFPAQALAEALSQRGYRIHLLTDERVRDYGKSFPAEATHIVPSASLSLSKPLKVPGNFTKLAVGYFSARKLYKTLKPAAVVGFGGYPSLPPLMAASHCGVPSIIHEQNSVLGRANKLLASRVAHIATSFETVFGVPQTDQKKVVLTGNPVRAAVLKVAGVPYEGLKASGPVKLLVFGGSQGASFFSDALPPMLERLAPQLLKRLHITQQARAEDLDRLRAAYGKLGISFDAQPFFQNMPELMRDCHLVICRSGASTIAELGVIGRPAIMVPLPHAIDNDQLRNAESFANAGGGFLHPQNTLNPAHFSMILNELISNPDQLKEAAKSALRHGRPDAAARLADLVISVMADRPPGT